jgi:hypothetical protein
MPMVKAPYVSCHRNGLFPMRSCIHWEEAAIMIGLLWLSGMVGDSGATGERGRLFRRWQEPSFHSSEQCRPCRPPATYSACISKERGQPQLRSSFSHVPGTSRSSGCPFFQSLELPKSSTAFHERPAAGSITASAFCKRNTPAIRDKIISTKTLFLKMSSSR